MASRGNKKMDEKKPFLHTISFNSEMYEESTNRINPISKWEEKEELEGLTLYDIYRKPIPLLRGNENTTILCNQINDELTCPICMQIIRHTMVVMECLHRFCQECMTKCLRVRNNECPSCRIHVPSRRSLRHDRNFDELISKIYPDLDKYEEEENARIADRNRAYHLNSALTESLRQGQENQASKRQKKRASSAACSIKRTNEISNGHGNVSKRPRLDTDPELQLNFILRKHPKENRIENLTRESLRTSKDLTIHHMKKFLAKKLGYPTYEEFQITMVQPETASTSVACTQGFYFHDGVSLADLFSEYPPKEGTELILHYRLDPSAISSTPNSTSNINTKPFAELADSVSDTTITIDDTPKDKSSLSSTSIFPSATLS